MQDLGLHVIIQGTNLEAKVGSQGLCLGGFWVTVAVASYVTLLTIIIARGLTWALCVHGESTSLPTCDLLSCWPGSREARLKLPDFLGPAWSALPETVLRPTIVHWHTFRCGGRYHKWQTFFSVSQASPQRPGQRPAKCCSSQQSPPQSGPAAWVGVSNSNLYFL